MPIEKWSEQIVVARLGDDPQMSEDLATLDQMLGQTPQDVVVDFSAVHYLNSTNIGNLLKLRRQVHSTDHRLMLCSVSTQVWGSLLVTGLDKIFTVSDNVATALATLAIAT